MSVIDIQEEYEATASVLRQELLEYIQSLQSPAQVVDRLQKSLHANTQVGRQTRALAVPQMAMAMIGSEITPQKVRDLCVLGWLVQLQTSYVLVADDIVDRSTTRRDAPTWWNRPEVGNSAVSDAFMLNFCIYYLLRLHFQRHPAYLDLVHLFHENSFLIEIGQSADHLIASAGLGSGPARKGPKFSEYNMVNYEFIITHKGGHFFGMGALVALVYLELGTAKNRAQLQDIAIAFGKYAQVQDDYLDAFEDPAVLGKIGTDIQEGKCTWLVIKALETCTEDQRKLLEENYGAEDEEKVERVKTLYKDLGLEDAFAQYEAVALRELKTMIEKLDETEGLTRASLRNLPLKNVKFGSQRMTIQEIKMA
ncbi:farnesyl pyrophosphate synthase [Trichoderma barbatum]